MTGRLGRLLNPKSIAVIGGGSWCAAVIETNRQIGYSGEVFAVHPTKEIIAGVRTFQTVNDLPFAPDAAFIGVNREATGRIVQALSERGSGGAICFASGFLETADGGELQSGLLNAAGNMPIIGPNCYGYLNYLDGAAIWPDIQGGERANTGVAILTQSSNIALNISMQRRGLPLAFLGTVGNQALVGMSEFGEYLLKDDRITALGLHIEGIDNIADFVHLSECAYKLGKRIVVIKVGASSTAQAATISHTASLTGSQVTANALFERLGIARADTISDFLESLKLAHLHPALPSKNIASMSCSGGEASLIADLALQTGLAFPALNSRQREELEAVLGSKVTLANPLDYHTYIWGDETRMTETFRAMFDPTISMTLLVLDFPRKDRCAAPIWDVVVRSFDNARKGHPAAIVSSIAENMPEEIAEDLIARGIVPFCGMNEALQAIDHISNAAICRPNVLYTQGPLHAQTLNEDAAKKQLAEFGVGFPKRVRFCDDGRSAFESIGGKMVLKAEGVAHKTEAGAIAQGLTTYDQIAAQIQIMDATSFTLEEQVEGAKLELLIGITRDFAHGFLLTIGLGGVWTELVGDVQSCLLPAEERDIIDLLNRLRVGQVLKGYRGQEALDFDGVLNTVMAIQNFVVAHKDKVEEVEINPLLVGTDFAIAVDALIKMEKI